MIDDANGVAAELTGQGGAVPGAGPMGATTSPATTPLGAVRALGDEISRAALPNAYYECAGCTEQGSEGNCRPADEIRFAPDETWLCEYCYDDAAFDCGEDANWPVWADLPKLSAALPPQSADLRGEVERLTNCAEKAEALLAGCKIALEQAWASNRELWSSNNSLHDQIAALTAQPVAQEPWGWWARDLTAGPDKEGFLIRKRERLAIASPLEEWGVTPLYAHPATPAPVLPDLILGAIADNEAAAWVTKHLTAIRRDNGNMDYSLKGVIRAFQAGKASATPAPVEAGLRAERANAEAMADLLSDLAEGMIVDHGLMLEALEVHAALRAQSAPVGGTYVIWSSEHHAWWGPEESGYFTKLEYAGRYAREDALKICARARGGRRYNRSPSEVPLLLADAKQFWPDAPVGGEVKG